MSEVETITHCPEHPGERLTGPVWSIVMSDASGNRFRYGGTCSVCSRIERNDYHNGRL